MDLRNTKAYISQFSHNGSFIFATFQVFLIHMHNFTFNFSRKMIEKQGRYF